MDINTISNLLSSFREDFFLISANQNTLLSTCQLVKLGPSWSWSYLV